MFAFHILAFQLMASLAWSDHSVRITSYTLITHAALSWLEQYAACWTQRPAGEAAT